LTCFFILLFYVTDSLIDSQLFGEGSFWDNLVFKVEPFEFYFRGTISFLLLFFAWISYKLLKNMHLLQIKLLHESKMLDHANRSKSAFLASMSHEIRTPLYTIQGFAELICEEADEHIKAYGNSIINSGGLLLGTLNEIFEYCKIDAGGLDLNLCPCDLKELLTDLRLLYQRQIKEKNLQLKFSVESPGELWIDRIKYWQILLNLVSNAIKFTNQGEVSIHIQASPSPNQAEQYDLSLEVKDTRVGIPQEMHSKLLQSTTDSSQGSGLGLAICKRLADTMGGHLQLQSEEGKGSVFTFILPGISLSEINP